MGGYRFSVKVTLKLDILDRDPDSIELDHGLSWRIGQRLDEGRALSSGK
jgi:hypothetical protein